MNEAFFAFMRFFMGENWRTSLENHDIMKYKSYLGGAAT